MHPSLRRSLLLFILALSVPFAQAEEDAATPNECSTALSSPFAPAARPRGISGRRLDESKLGEASAKFRDEMAKKVIGQPGGTELLNQIITNLYAGIVRPNQPQGALLFLGASGSGKTETVRAAAKILHGDASKMIRVDCAEFQSDHEIAKLIGSPPGYLGHRETAPVLTQASIKANQSPEFGYTFILFDEIEKASPALFQLLLGGLSNGRITLGDNTVVDLTNTIFVFTSNLGNRERIANARSAGQRNIGFLGAPQGVARAGSIELQAARSHFSVEFMGRLSGIQVFAPLSPAATAQVFDLRMQDLVDELRHAGIDRRVYVSKAARNLLVAAGFNQSTGARTMRTMIDSFVRTALVNLAATEPGEETILIDTSPEGGLTFEGLSELEKQPQPKTKLKRLLIALDATEYP